MSRLVRVRYLQRACKAMASARIAELLSALLSDSQQMLDWANTQQWEAVFELETRRQAAFTELESQVQHLSLAELPANYLESMQQLAQFNAGLLNASQTRQQEIANQLSRLHQGSKAAAAYNQR